MDYFCYISRSKIDQLYQTVAPGSPEEWTESTSNERSFGADLSTGLTLAGIVSLFKGGITYGRKGVLHREQKIKLEYVEKLRRVLLAVATPYGIPSLAAALGSDTPLSGYYHHGGTFRVARPFNTADAASIITVQTEIDSWNLLLDCSVRFFSEQKDVDGRFTPTSSNVRFFSGEIPLRMEAFFVVLHQEAPNIFATPLYLKLEARSDVAL